MAPAQYARVADAATICAEACSALRGCSPSPAHAAAADLLPSQAPANLRSVFLQPRRSLTLRHICRVTRMCERAAFAIIAATIPPALLFADASHTLSPHQCRSPCPEHFATSPSGPKAPPPPPHLPRQRACEGRHLWHSHLPSVPGCACALDAKCFGEGQVQGGTPLQQRGGACATHARSARGLQRRRAAAREGCGCSCVCCVCSSRCCCSCGSGCSDG